MIPKPYLENWVLRLKRTRLWNPDYNQGALCECGHSYYRHFDTWEAMDPCGCKYCDCFEFKPKTIAKFCPRCGCSHLLVEKEHWACPKCKVRWFTGENN